MLPRACKDPNEFTATGQDRLSRSPSYALMKLVSCLALACCPLATGQQRPEVHGGAPAVSPDGLRIAFSSNRGGIPAVFMISADGSGELELTHSPAPQGFPRWSSQGKQVIFWSQVDNAVQLYAIDPDGKNQHPTARIPGRSPVLSPDGRRVSYSEGPFASSRLWVAGIDGSGARMLTDGSAPVFIGWWSPDGNRIAFARRNAEKVLQLWTMNDEGTDARQPARIAAEEGQSEWPAWSPDGRRIALQVDKHASSGTTGHIWIVDAQTGASKPIAAHKEPYLDETPSWFPDGKRIAFQSNRTGRMEVWTMNDDGSEQRQITK
jgi:TolB protein